jgi:hypothetical protein
VRHTPVSNPFYPTPRLEPFNLTPVAKPFRGTPVSKPFRPWASRDAASACGAPPRTHSRGGRWVVSLSLLRRRQPHGHHARHLQPLDRDGRPQEHDGSLCHPLALQNQPRLAQPDRQPVGLERRRPRLSHRALSSRAVACTLLADRTALHCVCVLQVGASWDDGATWAGWASGEASPGYCGEGGGGQGLGASGYAIMFHRSWLTVSSDGGHNWVRHDLPGGAGAFDYVRQQVRASHHPWAPHQPWAHPPCLRPPPYISPAPSHQR